MSLDSICLPLVFSTVVTGVLKQSLKGDVHGISKSGGKGKESTEPKIDIPRLAENHFNLS